MCALCSTDTATTGVPAQRHGSKRYSSMGGPGALRNESSGMRCLPCDDVNLHGDTVFSTNKLSCCAVSATSLISDLTPVWRTLMVCSTTPRCFFEIYKMVVMVVLGMGSGGEHLARASGGWALKMRQHTL